MVDSSKLKAVDDLKNEKQTVASQTSLRREMDHSSKMLVQTLVGLVVFVAGVA